MKTPLLAAMSFVLAAVAAAFAADPPVPEPSKARAALNKIVPFEFEEAPLANLVDWLRDSQGLKVLLDRPALAAEGISTEVTLNQKTRRLPLKAALRLALEPLDLDYVLRDEVLVITTKVKAESQVYPLVYPVHDLLTKGIPGNPEAFDYDALADLLTSVIEPASWEDTGGGGWLAPCETAFVVSQSAQVHDQISRLLSALRQAKEARSGARISQPAEGPWEKTFSLELARAPLPEALAKLAEACGIDILIDRAEIGDHRLLSASALEKDGAANHVTASFSRATLRPALRELLLPHDLGHMERQGAVWITSRERAEESLRFHIYDVQDLLRDRDGAAETVTDLDYDAVLLLLMSAVAPSTWDDVGGPATLCAFDGFLAVLQTNAAHQQISVLLEQLRKIKFQPQGEDPPAPDAAARKALMAATTCDFVDAKLADVLERFAAAHKLEISLDRPALERAGVAPEAPVNLRLGEIKLQTALQFVLEPLELGYYLNGGAIVVTTPEMVERHPSPRVYNLADFAAAARKPKLAAFDVSQVILKTIEPASWTESGGSGTMVVFENTLVVSNSPAVHARVEELLAELRRLRPKPFSR